MSTDMLPINDQIEEEIDIQHYFMLFMHWAWLIVLVSVVVGISSFFIFRSLTPYYESKTTLLVNAAPASKVSDYSSVMLSEQLVSTYSILIVNDKVLQEVVDTLELQYSLEEIKKWITVTPVNNTQLIEISVVTIDPIMSANLANAVAAIFSNQIQEIQAERFSQSKVALDEQLSSTEIQIADIESQIRTAMMQEDKDRLESKATQYRALYSSLLDSYEQIQLSEAQSVSSVTQMELASPDYIAVKPKVLRNSILAAILGFLLTAGVIFIKELLDDTIKTPDEMSSKFKLPVLGMINHHDIETEGPISITDPRSPTAEAYRSLRTNVYYARVDQPLRTIIVTSSEPGEGKTTTLGNLGAVMAQNGSNVVLCDCDLRRPRLHKVFGLSNRHGLSALFLQTNTDIENIKQKTKVNNLAVISSGLIPPNPAELLGSKKMQGIVNNLKDASDIVLLDTPPILAVTDAAVLASTIDGVIIVVRLGKTHAAALRQTLDLFQKVNAPILGIVINDIAVSKSAYGNKYYRNYTAYQSYYGTTPQKKSR
jgi:succinoglycan biosynthesis transport protein ExoP